LLHIVEAKHRQWNKTWV